MSKKPRDFYTMMKLRRVLEGNPDLTSLAFLSDDLLNNICVDYDTAMEVAGVIGLHYAIQVKGNGVDTVELTDGEHEAIAMFYCSYLMLEQLKRLGRIKDYDMGGTAFDHDAVVHIRGPVPYGLSQKGALPNSKRGVT
jgi:hypothetical protein